MVYIINEKQLSYLINVFQQFINNQSYNVLCNIELSFDESKGGFILDVGISKNHFNEIKKMQEIQQLKSSINSMIGINPKINSYFSDCQFE